MLYHLARVEDAVARKYIEPEHFSSGGTDG